VKTGTSDERLPERLTDDWRTNKFYSSCMSMGICDISLQNTSLTHNVPNDNLSLRCGLYGDI